MKIALDAMGGDSAPASTIAGALEALTQYPDIELVLVGDQTRIEAELAKHPNSGFLSTRYTIHHASQVVEMSDSAIDAVRRKKDSSISRACDLIADGKAEAIVSAGHTGAFVAAAKVKLRTLPGIDRPGIATVMPTETSLFLLIDAGANVDSEPKHLVQFGIMGAVYSREVMGVKNPRVGLMNNGSEESKGNELTKAAFQELSRAKINFVGNVEGHGIFKNPVDVVVCDGFLGNAVLKTAEGLSAAIFSWLKRELGKGIIRKLGAYLAKEAFYAIRRKTNTEEYGGMPLLGVNGICIKAHGNSSPKAIRNAIRVAREAVIHRVNPHIIEEMELHEKQMAIPEESHAS